jgi:hypothetical protein
MSIRSKHYLNPISRRARATVSEREALAQDTEEALEKKAQQAEERRRESHDLVAQTIRRELAESTFFSSIVAFITDFIAMQRRKRQMSMKSMILMG